MLLRSMVEGQVRSVRSMTAVRDDPALLYLGHGYPSDE
jgi:hypothetical protein